MVVICSRLGDGQSRHDRAPERAGGQLWEPEGVGQAQLDGDAQHLGRRYEIRWGTAPGVFTSTMTATGLTYTTPAISLGTYYFSVRATKGQWRSTDSNEVAKSIVSVLGVGTCL